MSRLPIVTPDTLDRLLREGRSLWDQFEMREINRHHLFVPCDHAAAHDQLRALRSRASTFLEFGSAAGVVTILADLLGYEACGIEIEPWLVQAADALAQRFDSAATFVEGSFVPPAYQDEVRHMSSDRITPTGGASAYEELAMELTDFDLVFAYPWPGEEEWLFELMRRHARGDAMLLTYDLQEGFTATVVDEL